MALLRHLDRRIARIATEIGVHSFSVVAARAYTARMTLEIRHARTSDGVNIAYFAIGGATAHFNARRLFEMLRRKTSW